MRSSFGLLLLLVAGCGGSTTVGTGPAAGDELVPATPLPSEQASTEGPAGYVTLFSIDDQVFALPRFVQKEASRTTSGATASCSLSRGSAREAEPEPEVSAGPLLFDVATRDGTRTFEAVFDPKEQRYAPASMQARVEPGGLLRFVAPGAEAPAFEATLQASANTVFDVPGVVELDGTAPGDVPIRWYTEGTDDEVFVDLSIGDKSVTCLFASFEGRGTIPAGLVAQLVEERPSECTPSTCLLFMASRRQKRMGVGEWSIVVSHGFASVRNVSVL